MRRIFVLLLMFCIFHVLGVVEAMCQQPMTRETFRAKQQMFITEKAGLTQGEAAVFFPVYFELQDQKAKLNSKVWRLLRKGRSNEQLTDAQYDDILVEVYDTRIASEELDKTYYKKFRKILSAKKVCDVMRAEMRFRRSLLKEMKKDKAK